MLNFDLKNFTTLLQNHPQKFSAAFATDLDANDPLYLRDLFTIHEDLIPLAGHSLGPLFKPALEAINAIIRLQETHLHAGHFEDTAAMGGNWFDRDIEEDALLAMQSLLGFADLREFVFTQSGLSVNLANLLATFYKPNLQDWQSGKTKIAYLSSEFFSDQAIIQSVLKRELLNAENFGVFNNSNKPTLSNLSLPLIPDDYGIYDTGYLVDTIHRHAQEIQVLHLSDIVFNTGQRLDLPSIFGQLKETIQKHRIIVGLDLAHTVGNRTIDLSALEIVTYAVGCGYKHCSGTAGSPFGFYVNKNAPLNQFIPIQGWKAADSKRVFDKINTFDESIMMHTGAWAFRASNPNPIALAAIQTYVKKMHAIGWDKLIQKSECLTHYLLALLKHALREKFQLITPIDPKYRGATLVFRILGVENVQSIEQHLLEKHPLGRFEIDVRPPNNIRITAHYGYTRFVDIWRVVQRITELIEK